LIPFSALHGIRFEKSAGDQDQACNRSSGFTRDDIPTILRSENKSSNPSPQLRQRVQLAAKILLPVRQPVAEGVVFAAQAVAAVEGREFVLPDDVKRMVPPVLGHRLILKPESRLRRVTVESVLNEVVMDVSVPVLKSKKEHPDDWGN
jgi:hypothetical protein